MKYYQDITLLPDPDDNLYFLWSKIYQQFHLALVEVKDEQGKIPIGISLPGYKREKKTLGDKLRCFGTTEEALDRLNISKWLAKLSDYAHITSIRRTPADIRSYVRFSRKHAKPSKDQLKRRTINCFGLSEKDASSKLDGYERHFLDLPFIRLNSLGSKNQFRLFIKMEIVETAVDEGFNSYGLSSSSTVPWFN